MTRAVLAVALLVPVSGVGQLHTGTSHDNHGYITTIQECHTNALGFRRCVNRSFEYVDGSQYYRRGKPRSDCLVWGDGYYCLLPSKKE